MIISNCPKHTIEAAASAHGIRASIDTLSTTGLRHRVKLFPSHMKTLRVEAGTKVFFSATVEQRARCLTVFKEITTIDPNDLLSRAFRARLADPQPAVFEETTPGLCAELGIDLPRLLTAEKLAKLIVGRERPRYKRIAAYQRRSASHSDRAVCAVCWHGFEAFFKSLFALAPNARAYTAYAHYKGVKGFLANYPATADRNIGSAYSPMSASDACWCSEIEDSE